MNRLWATLDQEEPARRPLALLAAGAAALLALAVTKLFSAVLSIELPYLFCIAAVLITAVRNGFPAAAFTTSITLTGTTLLSPSHGLANPRTTAVVALFCIAIAVAGEAGVRLRRRERLLAVSAASRQQALQVIFETSPAVTLIVDEDSRVVAANEAARRLFGMDRAKLTASVIEDLVPAPGGPGEFSSITVEDGRTLQLRRTEASLPLGTHSFRTVYVRDETVAIAAAERLALTQRELYQIARATSLGQLGSSIAHELNQPLAFAANYGGAARAMLDRPDPDLPAATAALDDMLKQVFRAAAVLKRLRNFVGRRSPTLTWLSADVMLDEAARLGSLAVKEARATLEVDVAAVAGEALVDAVQVQQVILNLLVNAADAVRSLDERHIALRAWIEPSGELTVTVEDSGPGVPNKARRDVFAPFRSTKPEGVGIGLAVCRTIVEAHSGRIWCDDRTRLGGARFLFTLPWRASREKSDDR